MSMRPRIFRFRIYSILFFISRKSQLLTNAFGTYYQTVLPACSPLVTVVMLLLNHLSIAKKSSLGIETVAGLTHSVLTILRMIIRFMDTQFPIHSILFGQNAKVPLWALIDQRSMRDQENPMQVIESNVLGKRRQAQVGALKPSNRGIWHNQLCWEES
jgi:hypothetical protein